MAFAGCENSIEQLLDSLNQNLLTKTFLVGETCSYADVTLAGTLHWVFEQEAVRSRGTFVNVMRWYETVVNNPLYKAAENVCKPKEAKPVAKPKAAESKPKTATKTPAEEPIEKVVEVEVEVEEAAPVLAPDQFDMDGWKRLYQNTRDYVGAAGELRNLVRSKKSSVFLVDFLFDEENTVGFLVNNKVNGFYQRLDKARKVSFGILSILQDKEHSCFPLRGVWVFSREGDVPEEMKECDDSELYRWNKVNPNDDGQWTQVVEHLTGQGSFGGLPLTDQKVFV